MKTIGVSLGILIAALLLMFGLAVGALLSTAVLPTQTTADIEWQCNRLGTLIVNWQLYRCEPLHIRANREAFRQ